MYNETKDLIYIRFDTNSCGIYKKQSGDCQYIGELNEWKRNGFGIEYSEIVYRGHWLNDKKHGDGAEYKSNGECIFQGTYENGKKKYAKYKIWNGIYKGELNDEVPHGKGVLCRNNITYTGIFCNGKKHGDFHVWKNGKSIQCHYENDLKHGKAITLANGIITQIYKYGNIITESVRENDFEYIDGIFHQYYPRSNNVLYIGDVLDDEKYGNGTSYWNNGFVQYKGAWKNNKKHGYGIEYDVGGEEVYSGMWKNNNYHGTGKLTQDNTVYNGEFKQGKMHGKGVFKDNNENILYKGQFQNNEKYGHGELWKEDKLIYIGEWKNGQYEGSGTLHVYHLNQRMIIFGSFMKGVCKNIINMKEFIHTSDI